MTVTFLASRLTDASYFSSVDDAVRELEAQIAEFLGVILNEEYEPSLVFDTKGFITALLTTGLKIYEVDEDEVADQHVLVNLDVSDENNPTLSFEDKATGSTGAIIVEAGKLKLTDQFGDVYPIRVWSEESGVISLSIFDEYDEGGNKFKTILRLDETLDEDREIIHVPTLSGDDEGRAVIIGPGGVPELARDSGKYIVCECIGTLSSNGATVVPRWNTIGSSLSDGVVNVTSPVNYPGLGAVAFKFLTPGSYIVNGSLEVQQDGAAATNCSLIGIVDGTESISVHIVGGGFIDGSDDSSWGLVSFGGVVNIAPGEEGDEARIVLEVTLGGGNIVNIGTWGQVNISRSSVDV